MESKGMGLSSWLTIIFVIAKITGYITWSWWLVFSPVLIVLGLILFFLAVAVLIAAFTK